jgi:1-phosphofructokinase family hexose kinase
MTSSATPSPVRKRYDAVIAAPNPAVDSYYRVGDVRLGEVQRAKEVFHTAGGKGINLARAMNCLGGKPFSLSILGGVSGRFIQAELEREQIAAKCVMTTHETRRCSTIISGNSPQTTVFLESGAPVSEPEANDFCTAVIQCTQDAPYLVFTGSLPPGFSPEQYAAILPKLHEANITVCVDAAGDTLRRLSEGGAAIVKVNLEEFQQAFAPDEIGSAWSWHTGSHVLEKLRPCGLQLLIVTDGGRGAYILPADGECLHVHTAVQTWVSTAGAGDSFLAGLLLSLRRQTNLSDAVAFASAAAAANLQTVVCGDLRLSDHARFLTATTIRRINQAELTNGGVA